MEITSKSINHAVNIINDFYSFDLSKQPLRQTFRESAEHLLKVVEEFNTDQFSKLELINDPLHAENIKDIFSKNSISKEKFKPTIDFLIRDSLLIEIVLRDENLTLKDFKKQVEIERKMNLKKRKF